MTIKAHFDGKVFVPDEPVDLPIGAEATLEHDATTQTKSHLTGRELLTSGVVGIWADRRDLPDSPQFARELRERAQRREI